MTDYRRICGIYGFAETHDGSAIVFSGQNPDNFSKKFRKVFHRTPAIEILEEKAQEPEN